MDIPMLNMEKYEEFVPSFDQYHQEDHLDHQTQEVDLRKGPWTVEEDNMLSSSVSLNGEGRWNSLARHAGLKRTGKSCRLRWLNYLRPSVRRGNISLQEQLLILELHSRWGNRWSKIAQYLPGRTDNEIKNYWRTRVQKQAKQLKCDVNSKQFQDAMRHVWIPRLVERINSARPDPKPEPEPISTAPDTATWSSGNYSSDASDAQASSASGLTDCGDLTGVLMTGSDPVDSLENWWSEEDLSFFQQHLFD